MRVAQHQTYTFGEFSLDLTRGCLLRNEAEVALRPKSFAALTYLVENRGRLISKDELVEAVWPETAVTDNSLVQCLSDVRKALGEDSQSFVRTVPRRGYIFEGMVVEGSASGSGELDNEVEGLRIIIEQSNDESSASAELRHEARSLPGLAAAFPRYRSIKPLLAFLTMAGVATLAALWYSGYRPYSKTSAVSGISSIAILPFRSMTDDGNDRYLGLGMADAVITKIGGIGQVVVRPTSAVQRYAGIDQDSQATGIEQKVDAVLEGSVQRHGDRLRVTVRFVDVHNGQILWAEKYDEKFIDLFEVQDAISQRVAEALSLRLGGEERKLLAKHHTQNTEAYQNYLRGRYFWEKRTKDDLFKALDHFDRAIEIDPNYALAYAGIAHCYGPLGYRGHLAPNDATPKMLAAAAKALELDDSLAEAHTAMGAVKAFHEWDWETAEREFKRAIELNPNYPTAHQWYGLYLEAMGRHDENLAERKKAIELDPMNLSINAGVGTVYFYAGEYDRAIEVFQKTLELDPNFEQALSGLGDAYMQKGMYEQAILAYQKLPDDHGTLVRSKALLANAYAKVGKRKEAMSIEQELTELSKTQFVSPLFVALIHLGLGDEDRTFEWLERAYAERDPPLSHINVEPEFSRLRSDKRFQDLLRRMRLAE